jgi:hypothetical protein
MIKLINEKIGTLFSFFIYIYNLAIGKNKI